MWYKKFLYITILCAGTDSVQAFQKMRALGEKIHTTAKAAEDHVLKACVFEPRNDQEKIEQVRSRAVVGKSVGLLGAAGLISHALWRRHKTKSPLKFSWYQGAVALGSVGSFATGHYYSKQVRQAAPQRPAVDEKKEMQDCPICGVAHEKAEFLKLSGDRLEQGCGHEFCKATLRGVLATVLESKNTNMLRCPEHTCKRKLTTAEIQGFATPEEFKTLSDILLQELLQRTQGIIHCTARNCPCAFFFEPRHVDVIETIRCPQCQTPHCSKCAKFHELRPGERQIACEEAAKRIAAREATVQGETSEQKKAREEATQKWLSENTKKCPRCTASINKNEGCNHMTCKCAHEFCWVCMGTWDDHRFYVRERGYQGHYNCPFTKRCPSPGCGNFIIRKQVGHDLQSRKAMAKETCNTCRREFCWECLEAWPHGNTSTCQYFDIVVPKVAQQESKRTRAAQQEQKGASASASATAAGTQTGKISDIECSRILGRTRQQAFSIMQDRTRSPQRYKAMWDMLTAEQRTLFDDIYAGRR